jgi:hypothetical protein
MALTFDAECLVVLLRSLCGQSYTKFDFKPAAPTTSLWKGAFYLDHVDKLERRFYGRSFHTMAAAAIRTARLIR